jgi:hypothetical protein
VCVTVRPEDLDVPSLEKAILLTWTCRGPPFNLGVNHLNYLSYRAQMVARAMEEEGRSAVLSSRTCTRQGDLYITQQAVPEQPHPNRPQPTVTVPA